MTDVLTEGMFPQGQGEAANSVDMGVDSELHPDVAELLDGIDKAFKGELKVIDEALDKPEIGERLEATSSGKSPGMETGKYFWQS